MDKIIDITKIKQKTSVDTKTEEIPVKKEKITNPLKREELKKLAKFTNEKLSKKFDINDLLR